MKKRLILETNNYQIEQRGSVLNINAKHISLSIKIFAFDNLNIMQVFSNIQQIIPFEACHILSNDVYNEYFKGCVFLKRNDENEISILILDAGEYTIKEINDKIVHIETLEE